MACINWNGDMYQQQFSNHVYLVYSEKNRSKVCIWPVGKSQLAFVLSSLNDI